MNDGGAAFPGAEMVDPGPGEDLVKSYVAGMSLRDWFAGMVLQGLLASGRIPVTANDTPEERKAAIVERAFEYADAMLAKRNGDA